MPLTKDDIRLAAERLHRAGSFLRPIETRKGDTIQADYGAYGSVSCHFA
jgi:2-keto-4-pentenoate hydratase